MDRPARRGTVEVLNLLSRVVRSKRCLRHSGRVTAASEGHSFWLVKANVLGTTRS